MPWHLERTRSSHQHEERASACDEGDVCLQGPEQAASIKERLDAVAASESHTVDVKCVGSQVFAVLPAAESEGVHHPPIYSVSLHALSAETCMSLRTLKEAVICSCSVKERLCSCCQDQRSGLG